MPDLTSITEWERICNIDKNISVVSFSASWCGRCKTLMPMLERLSEDTKYSDVAFYNVNIDKSEEITKENNICICSIPVTKIIQNGKIVGIVFGDRINDILKVLDYLLR